MTHDTIQFINSVETVIPREMRDQFYGLANHILGLAKLTPRQAEAIILRMKNLTDMAVMIKPGWQADDPAQLIAFQNLEDFIKIQVWRATTLDIGHNERSYLATQMSINEQRQPVQPMRRRKFLGLF